MKAEIFTICEALFQEQMEAAAQLERQERAISELKVRFVRQMQSSKAHVQPQEIEQLFKSDDKTSLFNDQVAEKLRDIKDRNASWRLCSQMNNIRLGEDSKERRTQKNI